MRERDSGHLVFVSSLSGKAATSRHSVYSATKFGLRGFALGLREDLWGTGVGVSVVSPGFIREAGMFADSGAERAARTRYDDPGQVGDAVVDAIERDRGEIDVAPLVQRGWPTSRTAARASRRARSSAGGPPKVSDRVARGQAGARGTEAY